MWHLDSDSPGTAEVEQPKPCIVYSTTHGRGRHMLHVEFGAVALHSSCMTVVHGKQDPMRA